jgi:hypothetical protein
MVFLSGKSSPEQWRSDAAYLNALVTFLHRISAYGGLAEGVIRRCRQDITHAADRIRSGGLRSANPPYGPRGTL